MKYKMQTLAKNIIAHWEYLNEKFNLPSHSDTSKFMWFLFQALADPMGWYNGLELKEQLCGDHADPTLDNFHFGSITLKTLELENSACLKVIEKYVFELFDINWHELPEDYLLNFYKSIVLNWLKPVEEVHSHVAAILEPLVEAMIITRPERTAAEKIWSVYYKSRRHTEIRNATSIGGSYFRKISIRIANQIMKTEEYQKWDIRTGGRCGNAALIGVLCGLQRSVLKSALVESLFEDIRKMYQFNNQFRRYRLKYTYLYHEMTTKAQPTESQVELICKAHCILSRSVVLIRSICSGDGHAEVVYIASDGMYVNKMVGIRTTVMGMFEYPIDFNNSFNSLWCLEYPMTRILSICIIEKDIENIKGLGETEMTLQQGTFVCPICRATIIRNIPDEKMMHKISCLHFEALSTHNQQSSIDSPILPLFDCF
jgi:hypothetical protein